MFIIEDTEDNVIASFCSTGPNDFGNSGREPSHCRVISG